MVVHEVNKFTNLNCTIKSISSKIKILAEFQVIYAETVVHHGMAPEPII